ncbi:MAG: ABC transporter permease [Bacteroidales bacterium]|nr:ABC transporter permease [Bacteroidales bacterium]
MKAFYSSLRREFRRIRYEGQSRYLVLTTLGVVFCYVFFLTLMDEGQPQRLPIAIVDQDGSYLSRRLCHEIDATQGVRVVAVYGSHSEARQAMQRQEIYAFLEIPEGTYDELLSFTRPHIVLYSNNAYLLSGSLSYRSLATISKLASGAVEREVLRKKGYGERQIMGLIQPIELDTHLISNPTANYQPYVLTTMLPGMLGLSVLLLTVYMVGKERKSGTMPEWLGQSPYAALLGKMAPYTLWFSLLGVVGNMVLFGWCHFELHGSFCLVVVFTLLLVLAMQSTGVFLAGMIPEPHLATCFAAIYGTLAFTMAGFSYPVTSMPPALQALSQLFPLRHYYKAVSGVSLFGCGMDICWVQVCGLLLFWIAGVIGLWRLVSDVRIKNDEV